MASVRAYDGSVEDGIVINKHIVSYTYIPHPEWYPTPKYVSDPYAITTTLHPLMTHQGDSYSEAGGRHLGRSRLPLDHNCRRSCSATQANAGILKDTYELAHAMHTGALVPCIRCILSCRHRRRHTCPAFACPRIRPCKKSCT